MRQDLDPLQEARAYRRLIDELGLTRRGVAEHLGVAQKRVTERLKVLELPAELQPKVASGEIPPGAIKALADLAKLDPELPAVAAATVQAAPANEWDEPASCADVSSDPIGVVLGHYGGEAADLPAGVYQSGTGYPLSSFRLGDKASKELQKLCELLGQEPGGVAIRFEGEDLEQAEALGALHRCARGYGALIVGQDVADQLAGDSIARALKRQRARRRREWERRDAQANCGPSGGEEHATSEEEAKERRRREPEAEQEARRRAAAHNLELGALVAIGFAKVKLDERIVKLLATLNVGGELDQLAMRGPRYGFPGWVEQTQTKDGKANTVYIERRADAGPKAREYLSVAKTGQELAGRLLALVAMARYADEGAAARSAQSYTTCPCPRDCPGAERSSTSSTTSHPSGCPTTSPPRNGPNAPGSASRRPNS
jgi:hypothetical protein